MPSAPPLIARRAPYAPAPVLETWQRRRVIIPANPGVQDYVLSRTLAVDGTAPSRPVYTLTYPAGTDYGITAVWVVNTAFDPEHRLTVTRTFSPGDVLVIDCDAETVTVEDSTKRPVDFSGRFPLLDPREGANNVVEWHVYAVTAPTLTPAVAWTPRYLS